MGDLREARDRSVADMVEVRLDHVDEPSVAGALAGRRKPVVVTCRPRWEGGAFAGSEEERHVLLKEAIDGGAEFVDIEWRAGFDDLVRLAPTKVVVSAHEFDGVPRDLVEQARAMRQTGAGVIKVAVTPSRLEQSLPLREVGLAGGAVVVGMGLIGLPTRLLASWYGSRWTYAGDGVAPGQISAARMLGEFRFRECDGAAVYGIVGNNVGHSLSPAMHNAALADAGEAAVYVPVPAADFADFRAFASAIDLAGASVTIPFKVDAFTAATAADECARAVGAANTIDCRDGSWRVTNTDVDGFAAPLMDTYAGSLRGARVAVLGAGGAARAVVHALREAGAEVLVYARRRPAAELLADEFHVTARDWPPAAGTWDVLVNTTPLGGATVPDQSPLPGGLFDGQLVYDLTYGPRESPLLAEARAAGCRVLDGLPMLVAQAERQFEWWHGRRPTQGIMRGAAEESLER